MTTMTSLAILQQSQQPTAAAEHIRSDSVAATAIDRALSASAQVNWKIGLTVLALLLLSFILVLVVMELLAIRKAGGFKEWVRDVPLLQYRTVRMTYISEGAVITLTLVCVAHAVWPTIVGEVQMELVYGLFAFIGVSLGLNVTAFNIAEKNKPDASQIAAQAAANDPLSMPLVRTNKVTGETTVEAVLAPMSVTAQMPVAAKREVAAQALRDAGASDETARAVVATPVATLEFKADD